MAIQYARHCISSNLHQIKEQTLKTYYYWKCPFAFTSCLIFSTSVPPSSPITSSQWRSYTNSCYYAQERHAHLLINYYILFKTNNPEYENRLAIQSLMLFPFTHSPFTILTVNESNHCNSGLNANLYSQIFYMILFTMCCLLPYVFHQYSRYSDRWKRIQIMSQWGSDPLAGNVATQADPGTGSHKTKPIQRALAVFKKKKRLPPTPFLHYLLIQEIKGREE